MAFALKTAFWMVVLVSAYYFPYSAGSTPQRAIDAYLQLLAWTAALPLRWLDHAVSVRGATITGRFPLQIVKSCSALDAQALYVAAALAFPAEAWRKGAGLALGIGVLTLLNVLRISALYFVGAYAPESFDAVHEEWFPWLLVCAACLTFVAWTTWVSRHGAVTAR